MTFVRFGWQQIDRMRHDHASLLTCVCLAILLLNVPPSRFYGTIGANTPASRPNEVQIDEALQQAAITALAGREGTIIIMDAQTGRVRAVVNSHSAFAQALMPGSAIKPFTALAALRAGLIDENSRNVCPGRFTGLSFSLPCVHADHLPPFSPSQAIAHSCNYYFAMLGQRLGRGGLVATAREFGFGQPTGIGENDEIAGLVRPCEIGSNARVRSTESNHASVQADCEARTAVGESDHIQVTPIQLLTGYSALLNGGHLYRPEIANSESFRQVERARIDIAPQHRAVIAEGMAGAIRYGTARRAKLDSLPLTILGKTGTAMPAKGFRTNGWFVGLAGPFQSTRELDSSQVDLAVLVLLSRAHGSEAAAIARPIFETYAHEVSHRGTEAQSDANGARVPASPRPSFPGSAIKVHLVKDNVTEELPLEDYVLGVMRAEGSLETEPEALKALAIAIRTYAFKNSGRHAKDGYDFCSTTHCQRFVIRAPAVRLSDGTLADARVSAAVRSTAGQVLLDDRGQIADAYFGASCGGNTANVGALWGVTPPDYLRGVRDEYCLSGPHATWTDSIPVADLLRAVRSDARTDVGSRLDQVVISKRDETGRAEFITLEGEHRRSLRGWDFKIIVGRVLGWNILKSSRFEVSRAGSNFVFRGSGFGHGLGLCQEGAHVMAARGIGYQKILEKYFPGTTVKKDAETRGRGDTASADSTNQWKTDVAWNALKKDAETRRRGDTASQDLKAHWKADALMANVLSASPRLRVSASSGSNVSASPRLRVSASLRFFTISSEHFRVTYPRSVDRRDADQVLSTLESARSDFLHRAATASLPIDVPSLEIRLNESTGDFTSRTGQPWWAAAATKGNRIELQPYTLLKRRGVLQTTLRHELAHVFIDAVSRNRAPRWLEEGFSIYLAGEGRLFAHYVRGGAAPVDQLERRLEHPRNQSEMRELYGQAYAAVSEIVRQQGEASVWKRLAGG